MIDDINLSDRDLTQSSQTEKKFADLEKEIKLLQKESQKTNKPWYRTASVLISLCALIISTISISYSNYRISVDKIESQRKELNNLIARIHEIRKEEVQLRIAFPDDFRRVSGPLFWQRDVIAESVIEMAKKMHDSLSTIELITIGTEMANFERYEGAILVLNIAKERAKSTTDISSAGGYLALTYMLSGNIENGRQAYSDTQNLLLKIFQDEENIMAFSKIFDLYTNWVEDEIDLFGNCEVAEFLSSAGWTLFSSNYNSEGLMQKDRVFKNINIKLEDIDIFIKQKCY